MQIEPEKLSFPQFSLFQFNAYLQTSVIPTSVMVTRVPVPAKNPSCPVTVIKAVSIRLYSPTAPLLQPSEATHLTFNHSARLFGPVNRRLHWPNGFITPSIDHPGRDKTYNQTANESDHSISSRVHRET